MTLFLMILLLAGGPLGAANRESITRFEQKIQVILARIWGEETEAAE